MDISNWINLASAIGTIGATTVALWLALRDTGRHVDGTFIWEAASSYQPILLIQNTSGKIVVLESSEIKYYGKIAYMIDATEDFKFARQSIIEAGNIQKILRQHRTIAEASAVESPIRQETIGFPAHFFARAHNFKPPGRACQPEADSPMRT